MTSSGRFRRVQSSPLEKRQGNCYDHRGMSRFIGVRIAAAVELSTKASGATPIEHRRVQVTHVAVFGAAAHPRLISVRTCSFASVYRSANSNGWIVVTNTRAPVP